MAQALAQSAGHQGDGIGRGVSGARGGRMAGAQHGVASKHYWQTTDADFDKATGAQPDERSTFVATSAPQGATPSDENRSSKPQETTTECVGVGPGGIEPPTSGL